MSVFVRQLQQRAHRCVTFIHPAFHLSGSFILDRGFTQRPFGKAKDILVRPGRNILFMFFFFFYKLIQIHKITKKTLLLCSDDVKEALINTHMQQIWDRK